MLSYLSKVNYLMLYLYLLLYLPVLTIVNAILTYMYLLFTFILLKSLIDGEKKNLASLIMSEKFAVIDC